MWRIIWVKPFSIFYFWWGARKQRRRRRHNDLVITDSTATVDASPPEVGSHLSKWEDSRNSDSCLSEASTASRRTSAASTEAITNMPRKGRQFLEDAGPRGEMTGNAGKSGAELDAARKRNTAYEYLCHLEEARKWLEACLEAELPPASELEGALRNGVIVAKLALFFAPDVVNPKKIYDPEEKIYKEKGLVFRHTDNINHWLRAMEKKKFPEIFYPEITDLYDKKNMPRVIYCIHALSRYLFGLGIAPEMEDLHGVAEFTEEELSAMEQELQKAGVQMPKFGKIGGILAKELGEDDAAMHAAILKINQALETEAPSDELYPLLSASAAKLKKIDKENMDGYRDTLIAAKMEKTANAPEASHVGLNDSQQAGDAEQVDVYDTNLTRDEIQKIINVINTTVAAEKKRAAIEQAIQDLSEAIDEKNEEKMMTALQTPAMELKDVDPAFAPHYMVSLTALQNSLPDDEYFTVEQVQEAVNDGNDAAAKRKRVSEIVQAINEAVTAGSVDELRELFNECSELLDLPPTDSAVTERYLEALKTATAEHGPLSLEQIRAVLQDVNKTLQHEAAVQAALQELDKRIDEGEAEQTLEALQAPVLAIEDVDEAGALHYQASLVRAKEEVSGEMLGRDDVQKVIKDANFEAEENAKHAAALFALNDAIRKGDADKTLAQLKEPYTRVDNVQDRCGERYQKSLAPVLASKESDNAVAAKKWKKYATDDGRDYYFNKETKETQWLPPEEVIANNLSVEEVQEVVDKCNADQARWDSFVEAEPAIVTLQAHIRGMLRRKEHLERMKYLREHEGDAVKLQAAFRGYKQRKQYKDRLDYLNSQEDAAIKIQAAYKGLKARQQYKTLTKVDNPPVATVRRFLHLLDQSDLDFAEELERQQLKQKVVLAIRSNHELDDALNQMDIKIGLLVKNRIELDDVVKQNRELKKARKRGSQQKLVLPHQQGGLKSLTKQSRQKLESYQHLFYLVQTKPEILARLVFLDQPMPGWSNNKTSRFLEDAIQLIYNYASNAREQYLLLKLYRTALKTEIQEKVNTVKEIITGNPTAIKLVINQYRSSSQGVKYLSSTLRPLVQQCLADESLDLNTDPKVAYKKWINQQERETGVASTLPRDVTREEALKHEPVRTAVDKAVSKLVEIGEAFLDSILANVSLLPFGLRSICGALREDLRARFPDAPEVEITKVLGNVLYYRYINPAIIAPEAFGVIETSGHTELTPLKRGNLGSIAKLLQSAASGLRFELSEGEKTSPLNKFLYEGWKKFKTYFHDAATVMSAEQHFGIDEYSDAVMLTKPQINISPVDIYYMHKMLSVNADQLVDEGDTQLHEILEDLGPIGEPEDEIGPEDSPERSANKVPMWMLLANKFEVPEDDTSDIKALFVRTKRMVVDVIRFQQGKTLKDILETPATSEMEEEHLAFTKKRRAELDQLAQSDPDLKDVIAEQRSDFSTLEQTKEKILSNAEVLEKEGLCSKEQGYQNLLNAVAQDIRNQRIYRQHRKQDLAKLKHTLEELEVKKRQQSEAMDYYDQYVKECMKQMGKATATKKRFWFRPNRRKETESGQWIGTYSTNAHKLKERGVLVSVTGVSDFQLRGLHIDVSSDEVGIFNITIKGAGMALAKEQLVFQDLLQKQYENVDTMKIFDDRCTVNVNLLIFLINKKFYHK
ncbi:hypothetical protein PTSG_00372 [Salpingoeca rosetta]|uniref:Ras GTPase-activating-like protein IQGAP1 n=1 Tax=Salpingoeca rosetta (strain ATCC 50818 / BSB-021) TaxID=946362 RepID=F2TWA6_SALR5|nr:uncharacterized protein PTSG_00372 [Salpingoeca rosetta]EGD72352.1 hypothetical protein PTSG_00372 [Salpingoeca rosetta]|eukprot:XP_004998921.1 hypothetical protein PTSG_00372 [Salpingoeca rosetta]